MTTTPIHVPVTHLEAPELEMFKKHKPLAKLTEKNRVRLYLNDLAFWEATEVLGEITAMLGNDKLNDPWLVAGKVPTRACLEMLADLAVNQIQPYVMSYPKRVVWKLSVCEALLLWGAWNLSVKPGNQAPAFAEVMNDLHHLLA